MKTGDNRAERLNSAKKLAMKDSSGEYNEFFERIGQAVARLKDETALENVYLAYAELEATAERAADDETTNFPDYMADAEAAFDRAVGEALGYAYGGDDSAETP